MDHLMATGLSVTIKRMLPWIPGAEDPSIDEPATPSGAGNDVTRFLRFLAHSRAMERRPAVQRALARENAVQAALEPEGSAFIPSKIGCICLLKAWRPRRRSSMNIGRLSKGYVDAVKVRFVGGK
ncbi:hypothetical protein [Sphingobium nicotianae]|uniref:Uncharacterized protein n=1 Tax=Sphingobium nicotianae TaxID=2782607 RepID=A0A9X1IQJ0_9SPHN|nr:hypothetical protein [Sphingobium nicotianae]MBT2186555.1 hypothetical protein [Sphingobium nicotianae]